MWSKSRKEDHDISFYALFSKRDLNITYEFYFFSTDFSTFFSCQNILKTCLYTESNTVVKSRKKGVKNVKSLFMSKKDLTNKILRYYENKYSRVLLVNKLH